jgi:dipeptidyl aminopeptidase/acylaminoacyl peptidase
MRVRRLLTALLLAAGLAAPAAAAPLAAFGKLPSIESATISPSGRSLALVTTNGEDRTVLVKDLTTGQFRLSGFLGDHKVRDIGWADDDHLVIAYSAALNTFEVQDGFREWLFGSTINLKTKKMSSLMRNSEKADLATIFGYPIVRTYKGETSVFVKGIIFSGGRGQQSLFRVDLDSGANRLVAQGADNTVDWAVDSQGQPLAYESYQQGSGEWSIRIHTSDGWRVAVSQTAPLDPPYMLGLGRDDGAVAYAAYDDQRRVVWKEARLDGAAGGSPLPPENNQYPLRAALDGRLIGQYALVGDELRYIFYDPQDQKAWKAITDAFAGKRVALESWSTDRRKIIVRVDSTIDPPAFALVDLSARTADWLGAEYKGVGAADIGPRTRVRFTAADGLPLSGYLTLPPGRAGKNLPLIVLAHGGPAARDTPGFDWWAAAMASRGYAVLQVNYRGSDGLGPRLLQAGYGEWGKKMQTDLSDGVRWLAAQGTIDPKRVCIVGGSYGGYAALAGATLDRGVYRCAVSVAGVADLKRMVGYARTHNGRAAQRYWNRFMGADAGDDALTAISPAQQAGKADIPILLIHGKDDTVVPVEQSQIMADALRKAGKPVELVVQKGADHWLSRGDTRLEMLTATMAFVEKHNPPS